MKKVLSLWKVIVLVISSLVGVAGVTALSLYLMGSFDEKVIEPQDIYFEKVLAEGDGYYNADLSQYEVASDAFKMLVSSTTNDVTEREVKLSLLGQGPSVDGYISDGVIKVPEYVEIGKAFTITLEQTFDNSLDKYLILGGTSELTAVSSNVLLNHETVKIAVDSPVDSLKLNVARESDSDEKDALLQTVVAGETFVLETEFLPANSAYQFSDSTRKKEIFYSFPNSLSYISYDWDNDSFVAETTSATAYDTVLAFTFKNSFYQKQVLEQYSYIQSRQELTSALLRDFEENPEKYVSKAINIKVVNVDVVEFGLEGGDKEFSNISFDKEFTITANNSNVGDATLNLFIKDDNKNSISSLFSNVGLRLPTTSDKFDALSFKGEKLIKVEFLTDANSPRITKIDFSKTIDWNANAEGVEKTYYYLLPNTPKGVDYDNYFWSFSVESLDNADLSFELKANFFYQNNEGKYVAFCAIDDKEPIVTLKASSSVQGIEENIGWSAEHQSAISLTVKFDENGNPKSDDVDLEDYIGAVSSTNLYQTLKYFLVLPDSLAAKAENSTFNISDYFVCETGKSYTNDYLGNVLSISNIDMHKDSYTLYELQSSVLTAKKSFEGSVFVVAATVKTKADGSIYDDNGKYVIVKITNGKEVTVDSSLSIDNMTPNFEVATDDRVYIDNSTGEIYVPVIAKNNSGDDMNLITFKLTLKNCETFDSDYNSNSDVAKLLKAFANGSLKLECFSGTNQGDYVNLESLQLADGGIDEANKTATFVGVIKINKLQFNSTETKDIQGTPISLRLVYDDGTKEHVAQVLSVDGKKGFNVYYQQACEIVGNFEGDSSLKDGDEFLPINVQVNTAGTEVNWGKTLTLDQLNELLTFEIKDQFGNSIKETDGVYKIKFEETTGKNILSFNAEKTRIQNFNTTNGDNVQTALAVYVVKVESDGSETKVGKFDQDGNLIYGEDGKLEHLSSPTLILNVTSESIKEVWFDAQDAGVDFDKVGNGKASAVWTESSSTSSVVIERYIVAGDSFALNDVVRMYSEDVADLVSQDQTQAEFVSSDTTKYYQKTEFYFDSTFLAALSDEDAVNLRKMLNSDAGIVLADGETAPEDSSSLKNYAGKKLKSIKFAYPFNDSDIEIVFKATGEGGALFDVTIKLVCLADLTINTSSFNEYENTFRDYLVSEDVSGNKIRIFGGQSFDLESYAKLSSYTGRAGATDSYSWAGMIDNFGGVTNCTYVDPSAVAKIKEDETTGYYYLEVGDVYEYTTLIVSLYYGPICDFSCSVTLQFYVQPNIAVRQVAEGNSITSTSTDLDISKIAEGNLALKNYYDIYRLVSDEHLGTVGYLDQTGEVNGFNNAAIYNTVDGLSLSNLKFTNVSTTDVGEFVQISSGTILYASKISNKIEFTQGHTYAQAFEVAYGDIDSLKAVRIIDSELPEIIVDPEGVALEFNLVLGGVNGSSLLADTGVKTILYGGVEYLLLEPNTTYALKDGYSVEQVSGLIRKSGTGAIATNGLSSGYISTQDNEFVLSQPFTDGENSLTATVLLRAFVSKLGKNFVYYYNGENFDSSNMIYNNFEYDVFDKDGNRTGSVKVDFKDILELNDENVYQTVVAGDSYTVVHNSDVAFTDDIELKDEIGFYFSQEKSGAYQGLNVSRVKVSIVEDSLGLATLSKADPINDNYETILTIKSLEKYFAEDYGNVFITLKFEVYEYANQTNSFAWYYRIKVDPDFVLEDVTYPYADDAEYLADTHKDFDGEQYAINLEETFDDANSADRTGSRFAKPYTSGSTSSEIIENITSTYIISKIKVGETVCSTEEEIVSAKTKYFKTLSVSDVGEFVAKTSSTQPIDVTITKTYLYNSIEMIGSARKYVFKFNQAGAYTHTITAQYLVGDDITVKAISKENDTSTVHNQSITAGDGEFVYTTTIKADAGGNVYTNVSNFGAYVKALNGANLSDALKPYSASNGYAYSVAAGTEIYQKSTTSADVELGTYAEQQIFADEFTEFTIDGQKAYVKSSEITENAVSDTEYKYSLASGIEYYEMLYVAPTKISQTFEDALDTSNFFANMNVDMLGTQYNVYIKSEDIANETVYENDDYYYIDEDNKLHITPLDSIKQDLELEIGYYVSQSQTQTDVVPRVVFKVNLALDSYFNYELNSAEKTEGFELTGGKVYSLFKTEKVDGNDVATSDSLFAVLASENEAIETFSISLENGTDDYSGEGIAEGVKLSNLKKITPGTENDPFGTIEFAHLPYDATFKFKGVINEGLDNEYSFTFELVVAANVDLTRTRLHDVSSGTARYSNVEFDVLSNDLATTIEFANTKFGFYKFADETPDNDKVTKTSITYPTYVEKTTYPTENLDMEYEFNGTTIFNFVVGYKYKVEPSVEVEGCHPMPDGTKELEAEYISTSKSETDTKNNATEENFFNEKAPFASESRIAIEHKTVGDDYDTEAKFFEKVGENWTIMVSSISNLKLTFSGTYLNYDGENLSENSLNTTVSTNGTILSNALLKGGNLSATNRPNINITFEVENSDSNGEAEFTVIVNGVTTIYKVVVENGSAYDVALNQPNYTNNQETIYAEDLASESLNIFEQDRIASFTTKAGVAEGSYYLRFVNKTNSSEVQTPEIVISEASKLINIDLGKSYADYNYEGIFLDEDLAKAGAEENKKDDEIFEGELVLTERIVVKYGGAEIKFAENGITLQLKERITTGKDGSFGYQMDETDNTKYAYANLTRISGASITDNAILASQYQVYEGFYAKPTTVDIYLGGIEDGLLYLNALYTYFLDIELEIDGTADNVGDYTTYELQANGGDTNSLTPYLLMEEVNIYNKRTGNGYGSTGLSDSAGSIVLEIYGFSELPVDTKNNITLDANGVAYINAATTEREKLARVAGYLHKQLSSTEDENGIVYHTGLIPNYNMIETGINTSASTNSFENFITIAGPDSGKTLDYKLFARGANNDGNHIMMRLAYTVDIDGGDATSGVITKYHNLLFKVLPNSTAKFKGGHTSTTYIEGAEEIIEGQSVVTNYQQVYEIDGNNMGTSTEITLWSTTNSAISALNMQMYGSSANAAKDFTYSITLQDSHGSIVYNDWNGFENWLKGEGKAYWASADSEVYTSIASSTDLKVDPTSIDLGTRDYMIEFENKYGYKARFYIRFVAQTNPQIESLSTGITLTENTNLAFASKYYMVEPSKVGNNIALTLDLQKFTNTTDSYFANIIKATGAVNLISAVVKRTSTTSGQTQTVEYTKKSLTKDENNNSYYTIWDDENWNASDGSSPTNFGSIEGFYEEFKTIDLIVELGEGSDTYTVDYITNIMTNDGSKYYELKTSDDGSNSIGDTEYSSLNKAINGITPKLEPIKTTYTKSSTAVNSSLSAGSYLTSEVVISGLDAFAFSSAIDANALSEEYVSHVNNVKVWSVDFYYGDTWIGGSWATKEYSNEYSNASASDSLKSGENDSREASEATIVTNSSVKFINNLEPPTIAEGQSGDMKNSETGPYVFKVPYIDGVWFGTGDVLNGVTMKVTLVQTSETEEEEDSVVGQTFEENELPIQSLYTAASTTAQNTTIKTTITKTVNIKRQASTSNLFEDNDVRDGESPSVATSTDASTPKEILNDTLEVVLPAESSITFMVHDKEIVYTNWDGETATQAIDTDGKVFAPKLVTLSNSNGYEVVEYVGISRNIVGLEANLGEASNFYIYDFDTNKDGVEFNYNGNSVSSSANDGTETDTTSQTLSWLKYATFGYDENDDLTLSVNTGSLAEIALTTLTFVDTNKDEEVDDDEKQAQINKHILSNYTKLNFVSYGDNNSEETTSHTIKISEFLGNISTGATVIVVEKLKYTSSTGDGEEAWNSSVGSISYPDTTPALNNVAYTALEQQQGMIGVYNPDDSTGSGDKSLNLRINHVDELNSAETKSEILYFLLSENGETYQFVETFTVHPFFTDADEYVSDVIGDNNMTIDDYMVVENANSTYYIITLDKWAANIYLTNEACGINYSTAEGTTIFSLAEADAYQFYYQISSTLGGSAFIDENGMITTSTSYEIKTHQMAVDVFMKVSGSDGNFENKNTSLKLGTFVMNLNPDSINNTNQIDFDFSTEGAQNKTSTGGTFIVNGNLITLEADATITAKKLYESNDYDISKTDISTILTDQTQYSYQVGQAVDFESVFGHKTLSGANLTTITNKNYHIVKDGEEHIYYKNLNTWSFLTTGVHTIDVVVTGRRVVNDATTQTSSIESVQYLIKGVTVLVYDTTINEEDIFDNTSTSLNGSLGENESWTHSLDSNYAWYVKNEDGTIESLTDNEIIVNEVDGSYVDGVITKNYLAIEKLSGTPSGSVKNVEYTYFIYSSENEKSIALQKYETYNLQNLAQNENSTYKFFDEDYNEITSISFDYGEHTVTEKRVFMLEINEDESETLTRLAIASKIVGSSVTEKALEVSASNFAIESGKGSAATDETATPIFDAVKEKIANAISGLSKETFKSKEDFDEKTTVDNVPTYTYSDVWMLETMDGYALEEATSALKQIAGQDTLEDAGDDKFEYFTKYLVTYRNSIGEIYLYRFVFDFYQYEKEVVLSKEIGADNSYSLSNLNEIVKTAIFVDITDADDENDKLTEEQKAYAVRYFKLENEKLVEYSTVDAENGYDDTYLVRINNLYYKVEINLTIKTA